MLALGGLAIAGIGGCGGNEEPSTPPPERCWVEAAVSGAASFDDSREYACGTGDYGPYGYQRAQQSVTLRVGLNGNGEVRTRIFGLSAEATQGASFPTGVSLWPPDGTSSWEPWARGWDDGSGCTAFVEMQRRIEGASQECNVVEVSVTCTALLEPSTLLDGDPPPPGLGQIVVEHLRARSLYGPQ